MDRLTRLALILAALTIFARPSYGYLDPTSGSMILQAVLGGVAGLVVVVRMYWQRILRFFGKNDEPSP